MWSYEVYQDSLSTAEIFLLNLLSTLHLVITILKKYLYAWEKLRRCFYNIFKGLPNYSRACLSILKILKKALDTTL